MKKALFLTLFIMVLLTGCSADKSNEKALEDLKQLDSSYNINITYASGFNTEEVLCSVNNKDLICYESTIPNDEIDFQVDIEEIINLESDSPFEYEILAKILYYLLIDYEDLTYNEEDGIYELSTEAIIDVYMEYEIYDLDREAVEAEVVEYEIFYYFIFEDGLLTEVAYGYGDEVIYSGVFEDTSLYVRDNS